MPSCTGGDRRWSNLLPELLVPILQRLPSVRDRLRFGCVCSWWRSVLTEARHLLPPTAPLLMLPYTEDDLYPRQVHGIPSNWVHRILLPDSQDMSEYGCRHQLNQKKVICGSSMGWLLVSDRCRDVHLWNPITKEEIPLPRSKSCGVRKVILSSNPCPSGQLQDSCTVMVIHKCCQQLSFCRIRDDSWTTFGQTARLGFEDVICYRGKFYAVTFRGRVVLLDVGPKLKITVAADYDWSDHLDELDDYDDYHTGPEEELCVADKYLVESSGELLRVTRLIKRNMNKYTKSTIKFVVHKLDFDTKTWSNVVNLGDQALFLGSSSSVSFVANDGYKRNSIYFLDGSYCSGGDMGVFDLKDGSVTTIRVDKYTCSLNKDCSWSLFYSPRFWIDLAPW